MTGHQMKGTCSPKRLDSAHTDTGTAERPALNFSHVLVTKLSECRLVRVISMCILGMLTISIYMRRPVRRSLLQHILFRLQDVYNLLQQDAENFSNANLAQRTDHKMTQKLGSIYKRTVMDVALR